MSSKKLKRELLQLHRCAEAQGVLPGFLLGLAPTLFSKDPKPGNPSPICSNKSICWFGEWKEKCIKIFLSLLNFLGTKNISPDDLTLLDKKIFFYIRRTFDCREPDIVTNVYNLITDYQKAVRTYHSYPRAKVLFNILVESPPGKCNITQYYTEKCPNLLPFLPGSHECGVSLHEMKEKLTQFPSELCGELEKLGFEKFTGKYPTVFPDIGLNVGIKIVHKPVKVCACTSTSDMRSFLQTQKFTPGSKYPRCKPPTGQFTNEPDFALKCPGGFHDIPWNKIYTLYFSACPSPTRKEELQAIHNNIITYLNLNNYMDIKCSFCLETKSFKDMHKPEITDCQHVTVCTCCNVVLQRQIVSCRRPPHGHGNLLPLPLLRCTVCIEYIPSLCTFLNADVALYEFLKEVPKGAQVRDCHECSKYFHGFPDCGSDDIDTSCDTCKSIKPNMRSVYACPWCEKLQADGGGCDLKKCGWRYDLSEGKWISVTVNNESYGCGKFFCVGCFEKFDRDVNDWECSCLILFLSPKKYIHPSQLHPSTPSCADRNRNY